MITEDITYKEYGKITTVSNLNVAIEKLEQKRIYLEEDLKEDFHEILESLKPANILKHTIHEVQESTDLKHNLFKVALGLGAGYFSKKLIIGKSAGVVKKMLGTALQYGITNFVAKKNNKEHNGEAQTTKKSLLKRILSI